MNINIKIQRQTWHDHKSINLWCKEGSCRVEFYPEPLGRLGVEAYFCALWVEPEYRGRGVAGKLMADAESMTREMGYEKIFLRVYDNEADDWTIQWYERQGYELVDEGEDFSEMCKILK